MRLLTLGLYDPSEPDEGPMWHTGVYIDGPKAHRELMAIVDSYNREMVIEPDNDMVAAVFVLAEVTIGPEFDSRDPERTRQAQKAFGETLNLADPIHA